MTANSAQRTESLEDSRGLALLSLQQSGIFRAVLTSYRVMHERGVVQVKNPWQGDMSCQPCPGAARRYFPTGAVPSLPARSQKRKKHP